VTNLEQLWGIYLAAEINAFIASNRPMRRDQAEGERERVIYRADSSTIIERIFEIVEDWIVISFQDIRIHFRFQKKLTAYRVLHSTS
jgi:hypothetical protein